MALTIAGSDPSGGAGIQADLKTFQLHGVYGEAVISLHTVQNTLGVSRVEAVDPALIAEQLASLWADLPPQAVKTGALGDLRCVRVIASSLATLSVPLVVDPILRASSGAAFSREDLVRTYLEHLVPHAHLLTPNTVEAEALTGVSVTDLESAARAAAALRSYGAQNVLLKGGHLPGEPVDLLLCEGGSQLLLPAPRVDTPHTHGTGCTYSAAITARLARGERLERAVQRSKEWLARVIAQPLGLGHGRGPLNHFVPPELD
ncbi:MAG: bifunctional hydroxymethylpyrimidine kinase/phosphomethylpyrimidine kinase [Myxococcales bacterium]